MSDLEQQKKSAALLSVGSNALLVLIKLAVGLAMGSVSVISEATHSGVDLLAALIAWLAVRTSGRPADREHRFGHGKVENVSGVAEALLIFAAAAWIIFEAVQKLRLHEPLEHTAWGMAVMCLSSAVNLGVSSRLFKVGKATDSVALQADAWHLRTDVYTSLGVLAGLALIWLGGLLYPGVNLAWIDPAAALVVAALILKAAFDLTRQAGRDLLDESLPPAAEEHIREHIVAFAPQVRSLHRLRTRKSGPYCFVDCHLAVDGDISVRQAHQIAEAVAQAIEKHHPGTEVIMHVDPCVGQCERSAWRAVSWMKRPAKPCGGPRRPGPTENNKLARPPCRKTNSAGPPWPRPFFAPITPSTTSR